MVVQHRSFKTGDYIYFRKKEEETVTNFRKDWVFRKIVNYSQKDDVTTIKFFDNFLQKGEGELKSAQIDKNSEADFKLIANEDLKDLTRIYVRISENYYYELLKSYFVPVVSFINRYPKTVIGVLGRGECIFILLESLSWWRETLHESDIFHVYQL